MRKITTIIGALLIIGMSVIAISAPYISPDNPNQYNLEERFSPPSKSHIFGLDQNGRDVLSRVIYGARVSLGIGVLVVSISGVLGTFIGLVVGYFGKRVDTIFIFVSNVFQAFPGMLLAISIAAFQREQSLFNVVLILSAVGWVGYSRLVRGQVLSLKEREFVEAARAVGVPTGRIFRKHLLPNLFGPLVINATFGMAGVILAESTLSFLGVGVPLSNPSWGAMLDTGTQYIFKAPYLSVFPGIAIMLVVLGFNFLGDGLRDKLARR